MLNKSVGPRWMDGCGKVRIEVSDFRGNRVCIWQVQYKEEDEEEEGVDHPITKEGFHGVKCKRCGDEIHMYHRYYYKCSSCDFSLHKFCAELSNRLDHPLHPHSLIFKKWYLNSWTCNVCKQELTHHEMCYACEECWFPIHVNCVVEPRKKMIHHPCHPHSLICAISQPILCDCKACGRRHEGIFFQCITCNRFIIHSECAFLPITLLIQETTHDFFHHTHPLTLSCSFPLIDQRAKYYLKCRVCGDDFIDTWYIWIYKCDKCMYYVHVDCATSRSKPFMSAGLGKTVKNYKDADHPHLLHLPFSDETYNIQKHLLFQETGTSDLEVSLTHTSHQHPLILVDLRQYNDQTSSSSSSNNINSSLSLICHDPMKKTQLLCNGCLRPITSTMPFYKCDQLICNFTLHEWCTRLPQEIENHPAHPQHPLHLSYSNVLPHFFGMFDCSVCDLPCNGFAYCCVECDYYVDVTCGLLPKHITHEAHPNHLLSLVSKQSVRSCRMCLQYCNKLSFSCKSCDIWVHPECALLLPKALRHKYDKMLPLHLSYFPIENHKSEYFCEICEMYLNPHQSFYHCHDCVQSIYTTCAPLILQCETYTHSIYYNQNVYYFVNIKFGGIHNTGGHQHPLGCTKELSQMVCVAYVEANYSIEGSLNVLSVSL